MPQTRIALLAQKIADKPLFLDKHHQARFDIFDGQLSPGCYEYTIQKARKPKTHQQLKMIFGLLINSVVVKAVDDGMDTRRFLKNIVDSDIPSGVGITKDFLHQLFLTVCPTTDEEGRRVTLRGMSTEQANKFFEECRDMIATSCGWNIPDPNPNRNKAKKTDIGD